MSKIDYKSCVSGIIQRGEEIFPFNCFKKDILWSYVPTNWKKINKIAKCRGN